MTTPQSAPKIDPSKNSKEYGYRKPINPLIQKCL